MSKITLGKRPKNFKVKVTFPMLEGEDGVIEVSYIYRTKTEFGALIDKIFTEAGVKPAGTDAESQNFSLEEAMRRTKDANTEYLMQVMDGWDVAAPFTRENVAQLCDEIPAAAMAIMSQYRTAITEGKLGN